MIPATLPDNWRDLIDMSRMARARAWAPYSQFQVGAALQMADGRVFHGCNVENSSYGLTICAERVAMTKAVSEGALHPKVLCISLTGTPVPCGACRQFLYEFEPGLLILLDDVASDQPPECVLLEELLPRGFRLKPTRERENPDGRFDS